MEILSSALAEAFNQVLLSLVHNWPYLLASILIAAALRVFVDQKSVSEYLRRNRHFSVVTATAAAVATPLCSCGTTAVVLGMMAGMLPWAPIIAFMVASPLTSPGELFYSAGLFGWPFALTYFGASIVLGLAGGLAGSILESRGWLRGQARFQEVPAAAAVCACEEPQFIPLAALTVPHGAASPAARLALSSIEAAPPCGCEGPAPSAPAAKTAPMRPTWRSYAREVQTTGGQLLKLFLGFAFLGYFLNALIPTEWVAGLFGENSFGVPLAATLGLPFYLSSEASLPLVRALIDTGMSPGAAMAFLISGAGTSMGAVAGALTIARWRVIAVVVGTLWLGSIAFGYFYNTLIYFGLV